MYIYLNGLLLGLSLIISLGPQNIFLIRQGTRRNHPVLSAIVCFLCDSLLVAASIAGLRELFENNPSLQSFMMWFGAAFLFFYAFKTIKSAITPKASQATSHNIKLNNRLQIMLLALGFSLLNPHAIIDTLVIVGSGSSQYPGKELTFLFGVVTASLIWFSVLTMTTRYFSDVLSRKTIWQIIELSSGVLMLVIGIKLVTASQLT